MPDNDNKFVFVTGGRRSGKSAYAQKLGESAGSSRLYIATAEALDAEMRERVAKHQGERGHKWDTIEEPINIVESISSASGYDVILIDCLTLWLCNLIHESSSGDAQVIKEIETLSDVCVNKGATVIAVSNEIGMGVVPDNALSRRFSDLSGIMNQKMAAVADQVVLTVAGIPLTIKDREE